jgi:preprotein translocase subunit SecE
VTTLEQKRPDKHGLFSVYKSGQGKYVRWGTVAAIALIAFVGAWWLGTSVLAPYDQVVKTVGICLWLAFFALFAFWLVNKPNFAEFLIMTESEMRKVTWPTRRHVINSTRIVILMTVLLALLLWCVDVGFKTLFEWMKIL